MTGDKNGTANALLNLGIIYFNNGKSQNAMKFYRQTLSLYKQTGDRNGEARTLASLGIAFSHKGQFAQAIDYFQQALLFLLQTGDKSGEAEVLLNLGSVHSDIGQSGKATAFFQRSLRALERVRGAIGGTVENRQSYLASVLPTYMRLTNLLAAQKQTASAFAVVNQMKGRTLLEQALNKTLLAGVPIEAQQKIRLLKQTCDRLSREVAVSASASDVNQTAKLRRQLEADERQLQIEQDALFARYPGSAQKNVTQTIGLAAVPRFLPADTALLEFASLKFNAGKKKTDETALFVVTIENGKPVLSIHTLRVMREELTERIDSLREACADPDKLYKTAAKELASKLLPPSVLKRLSGKKRLVICPDGAVWGVPFAALVLPDGRHLIEQFELAYAYSATGAQAALSVPKGKGQGTLAVANPDFGDESRFGEIKPIALMADTGNKRNRPLSDPTRGILTQRGGIVALPGTQQEANVIHELYPGATLLTGKAAQEAELVKALPNYRYLHFATHGLFSDTSPLQSAIVLAQPPKGSEEDGFLTAREIYELKLNAEMAVLSACETARGKNTDGEGVVGLTWALFAAGVPTQVVSQWKVSDASTPELMAKFYTNLKSGQGKGKALRNAALAMLHDGKHRHPYHWAAFVLFGDWR